MHWFVLAWALVWLVLYLTIEEVDPPTTESEVVGVENDGPEDYCCPECAAERFFEDNG